MGLQYCCIVQYVYTVLLLDDLLMCSFAQNLFLGKGIF